MKKILAKIGFHEMEEDVYNSGLRSGQVQRGMNADEMVGNVQARTPIVKSKVRQEAAMSSVVSAEDIARAEKAAQDLLAELDLADEKTNNRKVKTKSKLEAQQSQGGPTPCNNSTKKGGHGKKK